MARYGRDFGPRRARYDRGPGPRGRREGGFGRYRRYERGFEIGPVWGGGSDIGFEPHWTRGPASDEGRYYPRSGYDLYW